MQEFREASCYRNLITTCIKIIQLSVMISLLTSTAICIPRNFGWVISSAIIFTVLTHRLGIC